MRNGKRPAVQKVGVRSPYGGQEPDDNVCGKEKTDDDDDEQKNDGDDDKYDDSS